MTREESRGSKQPGTGSPRNFLIGKSYPAFLILFGILILLTGCQASPERKGEARKGEGKNETTGKPHLPRHEPAKAIPEPGTCAGEGKIRELEDDGEEVVEETIRTKWKQPDVKDKAKRLKIRKGTIELSHESEEAARNALSRFKAVFGDPEAEKEALRALDSLGKDAIPAILNFMTKDINHRTEEGGMMGSLLWQYAARKAREYWKYEAEFNYGMFESGEEKWNAIVELKMLCLEKGCKLKRKK